MLNNSDPKLESRGNPVMILAQLLKDPFIVLL